MCLQLNALSPPRPGRHSRSPGRRCAIKVKKEQQKQQNKSSVSLINEAAGAFLSSTIYEPPPAHILNQAANKPTIKGVREDHPHSQNLEQYHTIFHRFFFLQVISHI